MKFNARILIPAASILFAAFAMAAPQAVQTADVSDQPVEKNVPVISYPATVVELFTSQGCSSCPPTNKLVHDIAGTDDVLALTYSVDYWDYLGWKDTLGRPEFSQRQRTYGKRQFQGQVYTPQVVLNGDTHAARFKPAQIQNYKLKENAARLTFGATIDGFIVKANGQAGTLVEVRYTPGAQSVPVMRGENRGKTILLANVVTSVKHLGSWDQGDGIDAVLVAPTKDEAVAILIQDGEGGRILTAANFHPF